MTRKNTPTIEILKRKYLVNTYLVSDPNTNEVEKESLLNELMEIEKEMKDLGFRFTNGFERMKARFARCGIGGASTIAEEKMILKYMMDRPD